MSEAQNLANESWPAGEIQDRLKATMREATDAMLASHGEIVDNHDFYQRTWQEASGDDALPETVTLRTAAYAVALRRCRTATDQRGIWP